MNGRVRFVAKLSGSRDRCRRGKRLAGAAGVIAAAIVGTLVSRVPRASVPGGLEFGGQPVGSASENQSIEIANTGFEPLNISQIEVDGGQRSEFELTSEDCTQTRIEPDGRCSVWVRFRPLAAGARSARLVVADNTGQSPHVAQLAGTGIAGARLLFSPPVVRFPSLIPGTASGPRWVRVSAQGAVLRVAAVSLQPETAGGFEVTADECTGKEIGGAKDCGIAVAFAPGGAGASSAALVIRASSGEAATCPLRGDAAAVPAARSLAVDPAVLDFSQQLVGTGSPSRPVAVTNTGQGAVAMGNLSMPGTERSSFAITEDGCSGRTLPAPGQCTFQVRFVPLTFGPVQGAVLIGSDLPSGPLQVRLTGTGEQRRPPVKRITSSPARIDSQPQPLRTAVQLEPLTVENTGEEAVQLENVVLRQDSKEFRKINDTCSLAVLRPGDSCRVTVTFTPLREGTRTAVVIIAHDAPGSPLQTPVTGTGASAKRLNVTPRELQFEPEAAGRAQSPPQKIFLQNAGPSPVRITGTRKEPAEAADFQIDDRECTGELQPQAPPCAVEVAFRPVGFGERSAIVYIDHDAPGSPAQVVVTGVGLQPEPECAHLRVVWSPPALIEKRSDYEGTVQLTGAVRNAGPGSYSSQPGGQELRIFAVYPGGNQQLLTGRPFNELPVGGEVQVTATVPWRLTDEFPPSFRLEVVYDPNSLRVRCGSGTEPAVLRPEAIQQLFRQTTPERGLRQGRTGQRLTTRGQ